MDKDKLNEIESNIDNELRYADKIMAGDAEYDGADGARAVQEICRQAKTLITELRKHVSK